MSEILTIASQPITFRWDYPASTTNTTDFAPSVFYKNDGRWTLYDNPAFWGPVKPMGLDIMFRPSFFGTQPLQGYVEFRLCNTPARTSGVFVRITRFVGNQFVFMDSRWNLYGPTVNEYATSSIWYTKVPKIVRSGGSFTPPGAMPHPVSPSRFGSERTLLEFGVIGGSTQIRDISLLRGVYWIRLSVLQEPEIDGQKTSYAALQMVTDTEHVELITQPGMTFCNDDSKLPATYGEMRSDILEDSLRSAMSNGFAYRNTVYYNTGNVGRLKNQNIYLRHDARADGSSNQNPTNFRHRSPTFDPYASDVRSPNSNCSEFHGNWLTYGAATLDSRQTHQRASSGCPTEGTPSHTPCFENEKTNLAVTLNWTNEAAFNNHLSIGKGSHPSQQGFFFDGDESATVVEDAEYTIIPSQAVQSFVIHEPCQKVIVSNPLDNTQTYFVLLTIEDLRPTSPYIRREIRIEYDDQVRVTEYFSGRRVYLLWDRAKQSWQYETLNPLEQYSPIGYNIGTFICNNTLGGYQLAPYCFAGVQSGAEFENQTRFSYPRWQPATGTSGIYSPYYHEFTENNYFRRAITYFRPDKVERISNPNGNLFQNVPIWNKFSILDMNWDKSLEEMFAELAVSSTNFQNGLESLPFNSKLEVFHTSDPDQGEPIISDTLPQDVLDTYRTPPGTGPFANIVPHHSYGWKDNVVQEKVSMWWLFTPQYQISSAPYNNVPENDTTMLSGNLDVANEGGDDWPNYIADNDTLRLDGIMQFTRRRYRDNFKRYGLAASIARYAEPGSIGHVIGSVFDPPQIFRLANAGDQPFEGAFLKPIGSIDAGQGYYWAAGSEHEIQYETLRWWRTAPWNNEPQGVATRYGYPRVDFGEIEEQAPRTTIYATPPQTGLENLSYTTNRTISSFRVRVYFSAANTAKLRQGEAVTLPMKRYRLDDETTGRIPSLGWNPREDVILCRSLLGTNHTTASAFGSRLGSDSLLLPNHNDVDYFEGSTMTFQLS